MSVSVVLLKVIRSDDAQYEYSGLTLSPAYRCGNVPRRSRPWGTTTLRSSVRAFLRPVAPAFRSRLAWPRWPRPSPWPRRPGPESPPADPLVKEGATVSVARHTWVIPDGDVGLVPNVGIIAGSRGVLVIDPGLGRRNGETVLREVGQGSRRPNVVRGLDALPRRAHDWNTGVSALRHLRQLEHPGSRVRRWRRAADRRVREALAGHRRTCWPARHSARPTSRSMAPTGSTSATSTCSSWKSDQRTRAAIRCSSSKKIASCSPAMW